MARSSFYTIVRFSACMWCCIACEHVEASSWSEKARVQDWRLQIPDLSSLRMNRKLAHMLENTPYLQEIFSIIRIKVWTVWSLSKWCLGMLNRTLIMQATFSQALVSSTHTGWLLRPIFLSSFIWSEDTKFTYSLSWILWSPESSSSFLMSRTYMPSGVSTCQELDESPSACWSWSADQLL